jgi:hypothetical protein
MAERVFAGLQGFAVVEKSGEEALDRDIEKGLGSVAETAFLQGIGGLWPRFFLWSESGKNGGPVAVVKRKVE